MFRDENNIKLKIKQKIHNETNDPWKQLKKITNKCLVERSFVCRFLYYKQCDKSFVITIPWLLEFLYEYSKIQIGKLIRIQNHIWMHNKSNNATIEMKIYEMNYEQNIRRQN